MTTAVSHRVAARPDSQGAMLRASANANMPGAHPFRAQGPSVPTLLCTSARGGSGTSLVAALIAVAAAGDGKRVLLIDGDDLVGPQALLLRANPWAGWQDLRGGRIMPADVATFVSSSLTLVAGGAPRHASDEADGTLSPAERRACMRRASALAEGHDLVVVDCGSRLETLFANVAPQLHERVVAVMSGRDPITLAATFALCKATNLRFPELMIDAVVNRQENTEAALCFDALDAGVRQFLPNCPLRFAGAVPFDATLEAVLRAGMPFLDAAAGSPAAHAAHELARRSLNTTSSPRLGV